MKNKEGKSAKERERQFYHSFFSDDKEFIKVFDPQSIDDIIPFRKENSKMKTMNDTYLRKLFLSKRFYTKFSKQKYGYNKIISKICVHDNNEKIENMTKQIIKLLLQEILENQKVIADSLRKTMKQLNVKREPMKSILNILNIQNPLTITRIFHHLIRIHQQFWKIL
ncbi:unnamed protein product (macronuclear) [Paramecium tetraurelia]|uniref:Uncharacterized protein n=1 Tax=Paramecium tetraurelia TaxID=5888 RepID=A0E7W2_PARTE|nr:uncharacterized protein GSPATT00024107001 [Paramecium tetraurelia]CAK91379.1 unnamed protein product [Paramecium tetraurelia]|eukprot:XP_001458776.1 hypothetical protein (macronuclear) [Paramecium tetraurelia strain d4-2]